MVRLACDLYNATIMLPQSVSEFCLITDIKADKSANQTIILRLKEEFNNYHRVLQWGSVRNGYRR